MQPEWGRAIAFLGGPPETKNTSSREISLIAVLGIKKVRCPDHRRERIVTGPPGWFVPEWTLGEWTFVRSTAGFVPRENNFFQLVRTRFPQKTFCNEAFPMIVIRCEIAQCRNFLPLEGGSSNFNRLNACFPQNPQLGSLLTLELVPLPWGARRSLFQ
jgi:hypothetical protein